MRKNKPLFLSKKQGNIIKNFAAKSGSTSLPKLTVEIKDEKEVKVMPVFVTLGKWTEQGIKKITESPNRAKAAHEMFNKAGGNWLKARGCFRTC